MYDEPMYEFGTFETIALLFKVTAIRPVQFEKALSPMLVTLLGMVTDVRQLQSEYLLLVDYQYYTL